MASIAQRLVTLCATLGEFPHIRFAADGGGRTEGVARTFQVRAVVSSFGCLSPLPVLLLVGYLCSQEMAMYVCFVFLAQALVGYRLIDACLMLPGGKRYHIGFFVRNFSTFVPT